VAHGNTCNHINPVSKRSCMIITRKERETNQQVLRRFNRTLLNLGILNIARDKKEFAKEDTRSTRKRAAVRREGLRRAKQWY
jgi:ribosomal protein S21